jgi:hypothetical protein
MSERTPIELGLAAYMAGYHASIVPGTQSMQEFASRPLAQSIAWVPGRIVEDVEAIIAEWRKNDNTGEPGLSSLLPVVLIGLSKDFLPVLPEFGIAVAETHFAFPDDELQRAYKVSTVTNEYRGQLVFIAAEVATAHSLMLNFNRWTTRGPLGRRFKCEYEFAGFKTQWPAVFEAIDYGAVDAKTEQTNLTVLVADFTLRATVPTFTAPKSGEANDGKAAPAGYPVVVEIESLGTFAGAVGNPNLGTTINTSVDAGGNVTQVRS